MPRRLLIAAILAVSCAAWAQAAPPTPPTPPPPSPASFSVATTGAGRPVIFVPGMGCPGSVWDETVARLGGKWQTHVLTLAGFAGKPAIPPPLLATARRDLVAYIRVRKLDHPILVGHSLGGLVSFWVAATEPDLLGGVVIVDAAPFLSAIGDPKATAESAAPAAKQMRDKIANGTQQEFEALIHSFFGTMGDPAKMKPIIDAVVRSDRAAVGEAFLEGSTTDLRPLLKKIKTPVLVILADSEYKDAVRAQLDPIAHKEVVVLPHTKHFVMTDDPEGFAKALLAFLGKVGR